MLLPPPPPNLSDLPRGTQLNAGLGKSKILADMDFETYSPAGFVWDDVEKCWKCPAGARTKGISAVGAAVYTEHPDAEVLCLAYDLKDGIGKRLWRPGLPTPEDLMEHIFFHGHLVEAWNAAFEYWVWTNICVPKYGWKPFPKEQLRCAMAKARAYALPGSLDAAGKILNLTNKKDPQGKRLLSKFSIPRNPTARTSKAYYGAVRIFPRDDREDAVNLYAYCMQDIATEAEASSRIPDLNPFELKFWQCDQKINFRGVQLDTKGIKNCIAIIEKAYEKYNAELREITQGQVSAASEVAKLRSWLWSRGIQVPTLTAETVAHLLEKPLLPPDVRRALEIRDVLGAAAVKKLYNMQRQTTRKGRVHDLFVYHAALTGRAAGAEFQPQNLPSSGPSVKNTCGHSVAAFHKECPLCNTDLHTVTIKEWNPEAVEDALKLINLQSLELVEHVWGDPIAAVSGCLRGLIISAPGHDLIGTDYSAIEAVVLAALSGEEWRLEVFRTHGKIYEMSASKISGVPFEEFENYKLKNNTHHPLRKTVGKVAELASGYQGGIQAWKRFGADEFFTEEQIKEAVSAWRRESPNIVNFWGGQEKNYEPCLYGLEGAAINAVLNPGVEFEYRNTKYLVQNDTLYCRLLSGRYLTYHKPRLGPSRFEWSRGKSLSFEGWNTNPLAGGIGWVRMDTYGGKLCENVVQATARDLLANAVVQLEECGYPVVLHIHDEIVCEVLEGFGSVLEMEAVMSKVPEWANLWPISASGGWRGKRYRKG